VGHSPIHIFVAPHSNHCPANCRLPIARHLDVARTASLLRPAGALPRHFTRNGRSLSSEKWRPECPRLHVPCQSVSPEKSGPIHKHRVAFTQQSRCPHEPFVDSHRSRNVLISHFLSSSFPSPFESRDISERTGRFWIILKEPIRILNFS
jgi:hypothetical protein